MNETMTNGTFRLKGRELLETIGRKRGVINVHQMSKKTEASYPTIKRYVDDPEKVEAVSLKVLATFLVDGLQMSPAEVANLQFGDVFEFVENEESAAK